MRGILTFAAIMIVAMTATALRRSASMRTCSKLHLAKGDALPSSSVMCDVIESKDEKCSLNDPVDFSKLLQSHKKAVLFAVPGAFTPTCSAQHLPGFIAQASALKAKGVDAVYCLSVNDKYVMKSWGDATPGFGKSGIYLVADGNAEFTKALGFEKDATGSRMGVRSKRYALIVESGKVTSVNVDEKGLENSSVEKILAQL